MSDPDPRVAPTHRVFARCLPLSRDDFWVISYDDDFSLEDDGKKYCERLLHFHSGDWSQIGFHGGRPRGLVADGEMVAIDMYGRTTTFGAAGPVEKQIADPSTEPHEPSSVYSMARIGDEVFVAGTERRVFRRGADRVWRSICPRPGESIFGSGNDLVGIAGSDARNVFAVGSKGEIWHWDGAAWSLIPSGTSENLSSVCVAAPDRVYVAGWRSGVVLTGNRDGFSTVLESKANIGSLAFFRDRLYLSTKNDVFVLGEKGLERIDLPPLRHLENGEGGHALQVAGGLLWSCSQLVIRVSEDGRSWTTLAELPGPPVDDDDGDNDAPAPRKARASDLKGLSPAARKFFLESGFVQDEARVSDKVTRAALDEHDFPAHKAALQFDRAYGGLSSEGDQSLLLGIHACLEGHLAWGFGPWQPHLHEELAGSRENFALAQTRTPIGILNGVEIALFMDEAGVVHCYSDTLGEWLPGAESGVAFVNQFASDNSPKPKKPAKKSPPEKPTKKSPAKKPAKKSAPKKPPKKKS